MIPSIALGSCLHVDDALVQACHCTGWEPDAMPHLTELLGLDVRRVIL